MLNVSTVELYQLAAWIALASFLVARLELPIGLAALLAVVRVAIPLLYFDVYFDGSWTVLDDVTYALQGETLIEMGYSPWSILGDLGYLRDLAGGDHILYLWWNLLAQHLFGVSYYAPVFLNVFFSFVGGVFMVRILREMGFSQEYDRGFFVFFMLHWDIVAWCSLVNLKDVVVMVLTIMSLYFLLRLTRRFEVVSVVLLAILGALFSALRFYVPILLLLATAFWLLLEWRNPRRYVLLAIASVGITHLVSRWASTLDEIEGEQSIVFGIVRFALTPQPWSIDQQYSFLFVPSILHWVMLLPTILACVHLWRSRPARLVILYLVVVVMLYAIVAELSGPRQRVQVAFILAWAQYHFLRSISTIILRPILPARARAG